MSALNLPPLDLLLDCAHIESPVVCGSVNLKEANVVLALPLKTRFEVRTTRCQPQAPRQRYPTRLAAWTMEVVAKSV